MKIRTLLFSVILFFISLASLVTTNLTIHAQENDVTIYLFHSETCPHCREEIAFLNNYVNEVDNVSVEMFEVSEPGSVEILQNVARELNLQVGGVPITVIGQEHIIGFGDEATTGNQIRDIVEQYQTGDYVDVVGQFIGTSEKNPEENNKSNSSSSLKQNGRSIPDSISVPFIGELEIKDFSLPVLTFVIALLDGFNPCAMWTLIFLITMLLGMKDRTRMWILGVTFIVVSAGIYFLFMSAWLNFFLFLGFVTWIRVLIGVFAIGIGVYYLRDYMVNKEAVCHVAGNEKRKKVFDKIKEIVHEKSFLIALGGIALLAIAVNLVEAICSAGLPAIYTQVLALSELPVWQYYLYLLFYILIFMLDDLVVFGIAMVTLQSVGMDTKYARYSHLIGGIVMLILGLLLVFKPEILMFG